MDQDKLLETVYGVAFLTLRFAGYENVKRWCETAGANYITTGLEVYCAPILIPDNVKAIRKLFPTATVSGNTNQSYILIQFL